MEKNKLHIKNKKRFCITIAVIAVLIVAIILVITNIFNKKVDIDDSTDISKLKVSKYHKEILDIYNQDKMMEKFLSDYDEVQSKVTIYILNNSTLDKDSFKNIIKDLNKIFSKEDYKKIELEIPTTWNGKWSIDDNGMVHFKFANKSIEPTWVDDSLVSSYISLNQK